MCHRVLRSLRNALAAIAAAAVTGTTPVAAADLTVFAAASLKTALDAVGTAWQAETGKTVTISYAASSALAKQIEEGAPADVFISADLAWMDYLAERDLVKRDTVDTLLGNRLVLIAPADSDTTLAIGAGFDLVGALGGGRLAMGQVESVPAGKYGKEALQSLGAWEQVSDHLAQAESVRAALALVAAGEAPLGIVYATDANAEAGVRVVATFPNDSHAAIVYPAAVTAEATSADADAFVAFLSTPEATNIFEGRGFATLAD